MIWQRTGVVRDDVFECGETTCCVRACNEDSEAQRKQGITLSVNEIK